MPRRTGDQRRLRQIDRRREVPRAGGSCGEGQGGLDGGEGEGGLLAAVGGELEVLEGERQRERSKAESFFLKIVRDSLSRSLLSLSPGIKTLSLTCFRGGFCALPPPPPPPPSPPPPPPPACALVFARLLAALGEEGTFAAAAAVASQLVVAAGAPSPPPPPSLLGCFQKPAAPTIPSWFMLIDRDIASWSASLASVGAGGPSFRKREERVTRTAVAAAAPGVEASAAPTALFSACPAAFERTRDSLASRIVLFFLFLLSLLSTASFAGGGAPWPSLPFIEAGEESEAGEGSARRRNGLLTFLPWRERRREKG